MTVKELMVELEKMPEDATVMYKHNQYGRVDIDTVTYDEEKLYSTDCFKTVTFEGSYKED